MDRADANVQRLSSMSTVFILVAARCHRRNSREKGHPINHECSSVYPSRYISSLLFSSLLFSSIIIDWYTEKRNDKYILPSYYIAYFAQPDQMLPPTHLTVTN